MLRLADYWVWDSWVADDGEQYHLYFLQAPRSLGDPGLRHVHATVGHATSRDLVDWSCLGQCLGPADTGFDDLAIWTGSAVRADNRPLDGGALGSARARDRSDPTDARRGGCAA